MELTVAPAAVVICHARLLTVIQRRDRLAGWGCVLLPMAVMHYIDKGHSLPLRAACLGDIIGSNHETNFVNSDMWDFNAIWELLIVQPNWAVGNAMPPSYADGVWFLSSFRLLLSQTDFKLMDSAPSILPMGLEHQLGSMAR